MVTITSEVMVIPVGSWHWFHLSALMASRECRKAGRRDLAAWYLSRRAAYCREQYLHHRDTELRNYPR